MYRLHIYKLSGLFLGQIPFHRSVFASGPRSFKTVALWVLISVIEIHPLLLQNVCGYSYAFILVPLGSVFHFGRNILLKILNYAKIGKSVEEEFIRIFLIGI